MLVGAFQIHDGVIATVDFAPDAGEPRKMFGVFQHKSVGRAGIEPDVENVVDLLPTVVGKLAEKTLARTGRIPCVGALGFEGLDDPDIDVGIVEPLDGAVRALLDEYRNRHAPGALARNYPVGTAFDHAVDTVLALCRHPTRCFDRRQSA